MKKTTTVFKSVVALMMLIGFGASAQTYNLVWQDEFNNGYLSGDWVIETGTGPNGDGWGNNELQYYRAENLSVGNGALAITARKENYGGKSYTSARIKTQGKKSWKYGKIEARIAMPNFQGVWPAFWMLGNNISSVAWPSCGEIDVMEHVNTGNGVFGTIHWSDNNGNYANYTGNATANSSINNYHTYSVEWTSSLIKWFIDGAKYHEVNISGGVNGTGEFHQNFFILLNMAIGGAWPGYTIDNNAFPQSMYVDYVRVYQEGTSFSQTIEAEHYVSMSGIIVEGCSEGGSNVGSFDAGDWTAYNVNIPSTGTYKISYRVASIYSGKTLRLEKDNGQTLLGTINIPYTGGWQNWTSISHNVTLPAGQYSIGMATSTGGLNINRWHITNNLGARLAPEEISAETTPLAGSMLYPNPVKNKLNLSKPFDQSAAIQIMDFSGNLLKRINLSKGEKEINMEDLAAGGYIIKITSKGITKVEKIYKE